MATTTNLTGPQYRLMTDWYKYYSMIFTYVVENRNEAAGTTTIKYSIFMSDKRLDNLSEYSTGSNYHIGENVYFGPNNMYKPYLEEFPVITHWYSNPVTENTFYEKTNTAAAWTRAEIQTIFNGGDSAYCRFWLLEDVPLIINDSETYNLTFRFENSLYGYETTETVSLGLNDFALLTNAPTSFTDEGNPTIQYTNLKGSDTARIDIAIRAVETNEYLVNPQYLPTDRTLGTYTFSFTETERERFYAYLSHATSGPVRFELRSEYNGKTNISTADATLNLVGYSPVLNPTIIDSNEVTTALTGDNTKFIKYHSTADFAVNAIGRKGASVISHYSTHNGAVYRGATGRVNNVETTEFTLSATDTRGITSKQILNINMIDYIKLTCNITADLPTNEDTIKMTVSGNFWNGNFGAADNTVQIQYRYKRNTSETYSNWATAVGNAAPESGNTYNRTFDISVPNHVDRYTVQARVIDKLSTVESKTVTVQSFPIFDWSDQDFNFNVPVAIQDDLSVAGNLTLDGSQLVDFVVQAGANGIWTWRKWASGIAECWGTIAPAAHNITTTWGSLFIKDNAIARTSYPFNFTDVPVVSMTLYNTTGNCWYYTGTQGTNALTPAFGLARGTSGSVTTGAQITAIGRWK